MTAKQELRKLVESLDELQAKKCLAVVRTQLKNGADKQESAAAYLRPDGTIDHRALLRLDLPERHRILKAFQAEVDMELLAEVSAGDADVDLIDE